MKKILKWALLVVVVVALGGLTAFLYFIPPFFTRAPEEFTKDFIDAAPPASGIADPKERLLAERGREIVVRTGCVGCHSAPGPQGPDLTRYLAGGSLKNYSRTGTYISRNLTPDPDTGLAKKSDIEVKRVLRSGVFPDGHVVPATTMPWGNFSNWTEEDRHAVVVYLRHLPPVRNRIPDPVLTPNDLGPDLVERGYAAKDYSIP